MLRNFLMNWQYGIKARIVDDALVAKIDTAVEPVTVRIALGNMSNGALVIQTGSDYILQFTPPVGAATVIAKFETREAAETARRHVACALYKGATTRRFGAAFRTAAGAAIGLLVIGFIALVIVVTANSVRAGSPQTVAMSMPSAIVSDAPLAQTAPAPTPQGVPMSADDFLKQ